MNNSTTSTLHVQNGTESPSPSPLPEEFILAGAISLIVGILGGFSSVINVVVIRRTKSMHTPCFALIVAHACFCVSMALGNVINAAHYLGLGSGILTAVYSRIVCNLIYSTFSGPASAIINFFIALERLWAFALPIGYKNKSRMVTKLAILIATVSGLAYALAALISTPRPWDEQVQCYNLFSGLDAVYSVVYTYFNLAFNILCVLCYAFVYPVIVWQKKRQGSDRMSEQTLLFKRQLKLLPMMNALIIAYGVFGLGPPLIVSTSSVIANGIFLKRTSLYSLILKSAVPCVDFCVMIAKCKDFTVGTKNLFKKTNHVQPLGS